MRWVLLLGLLAAVALGAIARAEVVQHGSIRVQVGGGIAPKRLPRDHPAPVSVAVSSVVAPAHGGPQPQLTKIKIEINRYGRLDATGLPVCEMDDIQPATTQKALQACRGSLVGEGRFKGQVALDKQPSFPTDAKMYAFSGRYKGKPAILAHVYGVNPIPTSFTLPFVISEKRGPYGTVLTAAIPPRQGNYVSELSLRLSRTYTYRGKRRSYATATCATPKSISVASFKFAKVSFNFAGGRKLASTLVRTCKAR
jgi:hypothetical protein